MGEPKFEMKKDPEGKRLFVVMKFSETDDVKKDEPSEQLVNRAVLEVTRDLVNLDLEQPGMPRPYRVMKFVVPEEPKE
jgi:hypothetical protein